MAARPPAAERDRLLAGRVTWTRPALPAPARPVLGTLVPVSVVIVVVLGVSHAGERTAGPADLWVRGFVPDVLLPSFRTGLVIDALAEPVGAAVVVAVLAATCLLLRRGRLSVLAVVGAGATITVTTVAKPIVDRYIHAGNLAYPSGHTALLTVVGLVVALLVVDLLRPGSTLSGLLVLIGCTAGGGTMALAQIALDAHYPTDTLGGFATAVAVVPLTGGLVDRAADAWSRRPGSPPPASGHAA